MAAGDDEGISNLSRALWTFLGYMLIGPFFAGLLVAAVLILAPILGVAAHLSAGLPPLGVAAAGTYVWAALPSALAAACVLPGVIRRGSVHWLLAAVAGVVAVMAARALTGQPPAEVAASAAFVGGLVSLAVRSALISGRILLPGRS